MRHLGEMRAHANRISDIPLGWWWTVTLAVITPVMLGYMTVENFRTVLAEGYEDYPAWFIGAFGWGAAAAVLVLGIVLSLRRWDPNVLEGRVSVLVGADRE